MPQQTTDASESSVGRVEAFRHFMRTTGEVLKTSPVSAPIAMVVGALLPVLTFAMLAGVAAIGGGVLLGLGSAGLNAIGLAVTLPHMLVPGLFIAGMGTAFTAGTIAVASQEILEDAEKEVREMYSQADETLAKKDAVAKRDIELAARMGLQTSPAAADQSLNASLKDSFDSAAPRGNAADFAASAPAAPAASTRNLSKNDMNGM